MGQVDNFSHCYEAHACFVLRDLYDAGNDIYPTFHENNEEQDPADPNLCIDGVCPRDCSPSPDLPSVCAVARPSSPLL